MLAPQQGAHLPPSGSPLTRGPLLPRDGGEGGSATVREKHQSGRLPYVPWPGTGPTALWCTGWRPNAAAGPEPPRRNVQKGQAANRTQTDCGA